MGQCALMPLIDVARSGRSFRAARSGTSGAVSSWLDEFTVLACGAIYRWHAGETYCGAMPSGDGLIPRPPGKLRPGQLGVVMLGRVIIGDVAVTLVDLAVRQFLAVQEQGNRHGPEGEGTDWSLTAVQAAGLTRRRESLLGYERHLLDAVTGSSQATVSSLAPRMPQILADTRRQIMHDAVRRGWLRHIHHDQRTAEGEQLSARIRTFQNQLRHFATSQGEDALAGALLPYAMHFGLVHRDDLPLALFARHWVRAFSVLPGWHQEYPKAPDPLSEPMPVDNTSGFQGLMGWYPAM